MEKLTKGGAAAGFARIRCEGRTRDDQRCLGIDEPAAAAGSRTAALAIAWSIPPKTSWCSGYKAYQ